MPREYEEFDPPPSDREALGVRLPEGALGGSTTARERVLEDAELATHVPAKAVVAVASGKGGVGKSTISLNLAVGLATEGASVGLLDADFYGPDIPLMVNLAQRRPLTRWDMWRRSKPIRLDPVERYGIKIMSVGFLIAEDQALVLHSDLVEFIAKQLIANVNWGELDYLIIDLPPGTADVQQQITRMLPLASAIVVVGPQDVAHLDAKKVVRMLRDAGVRILGGVENMSGLACPHCGGDVEVFPNVRADRSLWSMGLKRLGRIALDPAIAHAGDQGVPAMLRIAPAQTESFRQLARLVAEELDPEFRDASSGV